MFKLKKKETKVKTLYPVGSKKHLYPVYIGVAAVLAVMVGIILFLSGRRQTGFPATGHGLFSVMKPVAEIPDVLAYNDSIWEYLHDKYPNETTAKEAFGHHLNPCVDFDTGIDGIDIFGSHKGVLAVKILYDGDTKQATSQTVGLVFCHKYSDWAHTEVVDIIDGYLGVKLDEQEVKENISLLALGQTEMHAGMLDITFTPHDSDIFRAPHIYVSVQFKEVMETDNGGK